MSYESYSGSVISQYSGRPFSIYDTLKAHLINFLSGSSEPLKLTDYSSSVDIKFVGDYPRDANMELPTCVVSIIGERPYGYMGNFLFEQPPSSGASGSMIYGETVRFSVRFDIWAHNPWERDVVAGQVRNILMWGISPTSNNLYNVGIRYISFIGSEIMGYDQTDRIIKDVDHRDMTDPIFRRSLFAEVIADVVYKAPSGSEEYVPPIDTMILTAYSSSGSNAGYDYLVSSGSITE